MGLPNARMIRSPVFPMIGLLSICLCGCEGSCSTFSTVAGYTIVIIGYVLLAAVLVVATQAIGIFLNILILIWALSSSLPVTRPALYLAGLMDGADCSAEVVTIPTRQIPEEPEAEAVGENRSADPDEGQEADESTVGEE